MLGVIKEWCSRALSRYNNDRRTHSGRLQATNVGQDAEAQWSGVHTLREGWQGKKPLLGTGQ